MMKNKAVVIYGPPGAGKGTQADLLGRKYSFIHFDTGRYIESVFRSPEAKSDPILMREKKLFDTGFLCTPPWVLKIVRDRTTRIAKGGFGIVFSGSPRTMFEAAGDKKNKGLFEVLENLFGRENVCIVQLGVSPEVSGARNKVRKVCSICGLPKLGFAKSNACVFCGGPLRTRSLDNAEVIKKRIKEYEERTFPVFAEARRRKIRIIQVDGTPAPYQVFEKIVKKLKLK